MCIMYTITSICFRGPFGRRRCLRVIGMFRGTLFRGLLIIGLYVATCHALAKYLYKYRQRPWNLKCESLKDDDDDDNNDNAHDNIHNTNTTTTTTNTWYERP